MAAGLGAATAATSSAVPRAPFGALFCAAIAVCARLRVAQQANNVEVRANIVESVMTVLPEIQTVTTPKVYRFQIFAFLAE